MRALISLLFVSFTFWVEGQVIVYNTYNDYVNEIGEKYDETTGVSLVLGRTSMIFFKDGETYKVNCKDIWGFKYKETLFNRYRFISSRSINK